MDPFVGKYKESIFIMWKKLGRIFHLDPSANRSTHTQVPTVLVKDDVIRVYYSCRNNGMSFPAFLDIDRIKFSNGIIDIIKSHESRIMDLGNPGDFDSDGIMPGYVMKNDNEIWMYYTGWNEKSKTARYHNTIGLAVSNDGGDSFYKKFQGPLFDRSPNFPGLSVTPFILLNNWWRMWYISGISWNKVGDIYEPVYVIKSAHSLNGINWNRSTEQCVSSDFSLQAFSHPSVIIKKGVYRMWYCYRGSNDYRGGAGSYRIGYVESTDGINFIKTDNNSTIALGSEGEWDSEMQCYPYVLDIDEKTYMFYNGNDFGQTGIGVAVWDGEFK